MELSPSTLPGFPAVTQAPRLQWQASVPAEPPLQDAELHQGSLGPFCAMSESLRFCSISFLLKRKMER